MWDRLTSLFGSDSNGAGVFHEGGNIMNVWVSGAAGGGTVVGYADMADALYEFAEAYAAQLALTQHL